MAASAKRKQEEKHLKLLREMTSLPPNRKCFDCDQRGPTYANMTVGSFVCTSCSGILRGLNPPHRVKSISMTTFTQQEIEFLQKHGNEVCKQIWLGLFDDRSSSIPDFRDPQKVKEFLQEKYEKKRWYVPPEQAKVVASVHASISGSSASSTSSTPEVKPLKTLLGESAPPLHLNKGTPSQSPVVGRSQGQLQQEKKQQFDLLSDLGTDIFAAPAPAPQSSVAANFANFAHFNSHTAQNCNADFANFDAFGQSSGSSNFGGFPTASQSSFQSQNTGGSTASANTNFAHFDNFPKSSSADFGAFSTTQNNATSASRVAVNKSSLPSADKYAALADLDNIFNTSQGGSGQGSGYSTTATASAGSTVSAPSLSSASTDKSIFGTVPGSTAAQTHTASLAAPGSFGGVRDSHPVRMDMDYQTAQFHPFHPACLPGSMDVSTFGTASMSMPAGFGSPAAYNLPTSYSGTFQQPLFPTQAPFSQPTTFSQQPNGAGFAVFGQAKQVVMPFGQVAAPGLTSNPFMAGGSTGQFPAGSSSTNPFL
uniref:Arf-GAP domain and FG repeat-containing protein 1 n=1 Tax=Geotrypetes seraphini TaxID=260995 RepID=A0A6P8SBX3_GEOSA|nr:arf-GAP domain and FG repeat-containing protein 1 isoform X9 [Geotrypetes seraphini]